MRALVVVASLTACFSKPPPPPNGATDGGRDGAPSIDGSTTTDGPAPCAHWGPFGTPTQILIQALANTGAQNVTVSSDGLDLLFDQGATFYESLRATTGGSFTQVGTVLGFGSAPVQGAWLSTDHLILFYINSSMLFVTHRSALDSAFLTPGVPLIAGADDAAATNDRLRVVISSNNTLRLVKLTTADDPTGATEGALLDNSPNEGDTTPSIGDHGRKLVWTKTNLVQPTSSVLVEGDFDGNQLSNPHALIPDVGAFDTDPNLSDDGTTLYFTSTRNPSDTTAQLFVATRTCN